MEIENVYLMLGEYQVLLEIIRVTLRFQAVEISTDLSRVDRYQSNPRMCLRLLEYLNPKSRHHGKR
jgi:hypothetical protein